MTKKNITEKKRVLYFDDEPFITKAQAMSLELLGWDVTQVSEIDELFKELKYANFDIIILDIMAPLPNENNKYISFSSEEIEAMDGGPNVGIILAKKIWDKDSTLPILFLSARQIPDDAKDEFNHNGFKWEYLRKPELAKTVDAELVKLLNLQSSN
jgi:CheY-like chemotaxis protein